MILLFNIGFFLSCTSEPINDKILKKVINEFIIEHEKEIKERIDYEKINNIIVYVNKEDELIPQTSPPREGEFFEVITYPNLDLYVLYYDNSYFDNKFSPPPSKLFYVEGYPVMLFDKDIPPIDKKCIPKYLYKNETRSTGGDEWLVAIHKKSHKYIVIHNSYMKENETIEEVNKFSCEEKIIYEKLNLIPPNNISNN